MTRATGCGDRRVGVGPMQIESPADVQCFRFEAVLINAILTLSAEGAAQMRFASGFKIDDLLSSILLTHPRVTGNAKKFSVSLTY
jgi:hypothetical protein